MTFVTFHWSTYTGRDLIICLEGASSVTVFQPLNFWVGIYPINVFLCQMPHYICKRQTPVSLTGLVAASLPFLSLMCDPCCSCVFPWFKKDLSLKKDHEQRPHFRKAGKQINKYSVKDNDISFFSYYFSIFFFIGSFTPLSFYKQLVGMNRDLGCPAGIQPDCVKNVCYQSSGWE